jgi:hypothetical protein
MCEQCTRREFLGTAGALGGMAWAASNLAIGNETPLPVTPPASKVRICAMVAGAPPKPSRPAHRRSPRIRDACIAHT